MIVLIMRIRNRILCIIVSAFFCVSANAQQTDPTLTGAVAAQTQMLKELFKKRDKTQKQIIAAEAGVALAMERMHQVEEKVLGYLQNAQGAMQNLYQIKRATELVGVEIPRNMSLLRKAVPRNLKGTAIATLVSDELLDATTQMMSLYPFMKQLVTSGSYTVDGYDDAGNPIQVKQKVNLLNSAERYYIANEVVTRLESINTDLWLLAWQVQTMSWNDLFFSLDPQGWATVMSGKYIVEGLIWEWQYL